MAGRTIGVVQWVATLAMLMAASSVSASEDPDRIVLNVAGDVAWPDGWVGVEIIDERKEALFEQVQPILDRADLNFVNLECPFTTAKVVVDKRYPITCHPKRLRYAVDAGLNLLSLANNHSLDAGQQGLADTRALLAEATSKERPLWWNGTGETPKQANAPTVFTPPGKNIKIAFFAVGNTRGSSTIASFNAPRLTDRITAAAKEADIVLVSVHYGREYVHVPTRRTVRRFHALIDAGASLVVAHHAHVVQGVEAYGDGFIFYGLGNYSFGSRTRRHLATDTRLFSMMGQVTFERDAIAQVELIPLYVDNRKTWSLEGKTLHPRHATPQVLEQAFARVVLQQLEALTAAVPTRESTTLFRVGDRLFADLDVGGPAREREPGGR